MTISDSLIFCGFMLIIVCGVIGISYLTEGKREMKTKLTDVELVVVIDGLRLLSMNTKYPADKKVAQDLTERLRNERQCQKKKQ